MQSTAQRPPQSSACRLSHSEPARSSRTSRPYQTHQPSLSLRAPTCWQGGEIAAVQVEGAQRTQPPGHIAILNKGSEVQGLGFGVQGRAGLFQALRARLHPHLLWTRLWGPPEITLSCHCGQCSAGKARVVFWFSTGMCVTGSFARPLYHERCLRVGSQRPGPATGRHTECTLGGTAARARTWRGCRPSAQERWVTSSRPHCCISMLIRACGTPPAPTAPCSLAVALGADTPTAGSRVEDSGLRPWALHL